MLAEFRDLVDDLLRDGARWVTPEQRERAIGLALSRYSTDRPRFLFEDVTSAGGKVLPLPEGWSPGESGLCSVETPVGQIPPAMLAPDSIALYTGPQGEEIRIARALAADEVARVGYSAPHVLTDSEDTVPPRHREALACYAAGLLCEQIATEHAGAQDATIAADRVDQAHPAREWAARARSYRNRYYATLGIQIGRDGLPEPRMEPAGAVVNLDLPTTHGRRRYRR